MPRYASQNLAALDPDFRKANNISLSGNKKKSGRYRYGQQNNVFIASGRELTESGLCFRFLPIQEEENGVRKPAEFRQGRDGVAMGDWCRLVTCAHWVGNPGICFIVHDGNPELNLYDSPLHVLRKAAWDNKETPGIGRLFSELLLNQFTRDSHIGSLKKPEDTLFVSASAVYLGANNMPVIGAYDDDRNPDERDRGARIIGFKKSAAQALLAALRVRDEETGEFLVNDMLSFDAAPLVTILPNGYQSGGQRLMGVDVEGPTTFHAPPYVKGSNSQYVVGYPQSRTDVTHFAIIHDTYGGHPVTLDACRDRVEAETQTFDDHLWVPSYEEQAEMLSTVFPREALEYAWQDFPEYMRTLPTGAKTVEVREMPEEAKPVSAQEVRARAQTAAAKSSNAVPTGAPWGDEAPAGEISEEEAAGVADMFSAAAAEEPAVTTTAAQNPADVLNRARARLAKNSPKGGRR
jgi:hypothetical protein